MHTITTLAFCIENLMFFKRDLTLHVDVQNQYSAVQLALDFVPECFTSSAALQMIFPNPTPCNVNSHI